MTTLKRRLTLALCAVMLLLSLAACGGDANADSPVTSASATEAVTEDETRETERSETKDTLPELDFGGQTYRIYSNGFAWSGNSKNYYIEGPEELTGDLVYDTVIERNQKIEDRLNIKLEYTVEEEADVLSVAQTIRPIIMSGEDAYDIMICGQYGMLQLVAEGLFQNVNEGQYFDFEQPWWWSDYMDEISIGRDKRFFLVGDYFIDMLQGTNMVYYNKVLYSDYHGAADELYTEVLDGKWTIDRMTELVKSSYIDLNGDTKVDDGDIFGITTHKLLGAIDPYMIGSNVGFVSRDEDGIVTLSGYDDRAATLAEKLNTLFYNDGAHIADYMSDNVSIFTSGRALFIGKVTFDTSDMLRDMEDDYGMIPMPKYDEQQENYRSLVQDDRNLGAVPVTAESLELTSAVIEALCAESYRNLVPAYYEMSLKVKYTRDDIASQMIDIIHDTTATEFSFAYYESLNDLGQIYRNLLKAKSTNFASQYQRIENGAQKGLDKLVETYLANN